MSANERFSYAMLDTAGQLVFTVISSYLLYFYTDVAKLPVATAGIILLVARLFDGIDAPIWGSIIDMTNSKYGRARPYFLWLAIPFSIFGVLTFWAPQVGLTGKIWWCAVTYIITGILYTGLNTPLTAVLPLLTPDPSERLKLNSWRMTGSQLGVLIVNATTLPLVAFLGRGNDVNGFRWLIILFAAVSAIMTLYSFAHIKERVHTTNERVPLNKSVKAMKKNWPWIIIFISNFFFWIALTERTSTLVYYFTYNLGNKGLVTIFNSIASVQIAGMLAIPLINKFMSKKNLWISALVLAIIGQFIIMIGDHNLTIVVVGWILANLGSGIACSMPFAMLGSAVDYGKWKNGVNATGLLTALGTSFCLKVGSGLAGFIPSMIMASFGYIANKTQSTHALLGISISFHWVTIVCFAIAIIPLLFYKKFEDMEDEIRESVVADSQAEIQDDKETAK
ncbi:xylose-proton symporter [Furfurilactobacillus rossiae DSM 15814]|uniref:Xylose-proton symporter n=1 Tax=Furfurilactobacillus rossiae DSM 15814 TaxID=1114972 RepID=A0A0R1RA85_9LACO|nr:xylose-proton symporter [Furfurilactobacillus rossiae DSM 15814]